ncbi:MAG: hypothetical protein M3Q37_01900, partial [Gemmatimonadota bacterium]|nr:hypothetical protein [Gemmatimonadota bacterium]
MTNSSTNQRVVTACLAILAAVLISRDMRAQTESMGPRAAPTAKVVVLPVALYNAQANVQEASDSSQAALSTQVLTAKLRELLGAQLLA